MEPSLASYLAHSHNKGLRAQQLYCQSIAIFLFHAQAAVLDEIQVASDYILHLSHCAMLSLGRGMATTVVAQRHLWPMLM